VLTIDCKEFGIPPGAALKYLASRQVRQQHYILQYHSLQHYKEKWIIHENNNNDPKLGAPLVSSYGVLKVRLDRRFVESVINQLVIDDKQY
jgi:hypothetical protein